MSENVILYEYTICVDGLEMEKKNNKFKMGECMMSEKQTDISTTEKITVNLNVVELGYIDMLVNEGYYSNRTDFIKASIRKQLDNHSKDTSKLLERKESLGYDYTIGIGGFTKKQLEMLLEKGVKKKVIFVGLFIIPKDISLELLEQTIESIKVYGICKCPNEVKRLYSL